MTKSWMGTTKYTTSPLSTTLLTSSPNPYHHANMHIFLSPLELDMFEGVCYNKHICNSFSPYPHKRRRTKNTADTRQTDHEHQRWHLIWRDKIRYRSNHNDWSRTTHPPEMTSPDARTQTHRENDTHRKPSIPCKSTDQHGTEKWTLRQTMTLHIQKKTKTHPRTKRAYTQHTRQIPPSPSQHFIVIIHMDGKLTRQT